MRADDEDEIRRVLRTEARPQQMNTEEHARILARLERTDTANRPAPERADHPGTAPFVIADQRHGQRRSGVRSILVGCAAATLIVALVAGLLALRSEPDVGPTVPQIDTTPSCPDEWNAEHVVPLADAVALWRTVENWAFTQGEPDLGALAGAALEAASNLPDTDQRGRAVTALDDLTDSLSTIDDRSIVDSQRAARTRTDAIEGAIAVVNEISRSFGGSCELRVVETGP